VVIVMFNKKKENKMNKILIPVLAVMLFAGRGYCAEEVQAPKVFGGVIAEVTSMTAVVEAIDESTRMVTLKDEDGKELTVKAGPEVRNFAQIKKGDKVNIAYSESVTIAVTDEAMAPERQDSVDIVRAPLGEKPSGLITSTTQATATVEAIDYEKRTVTLKGPLQTLTVQVSEDAQNFNNVKVGDTVFLDYTERLAISVTP
jgi:Cu/Ag efflux protein CusF